MKRKIILFIYMFISLKIIYAYGYYETHKQSNSIIWDVKTYWDNRVSQKVLMNNTKMTESGIKEWTERVIKNDFDARIENLANLISFDSDTNYGDDDIEDTYVIMKNGICFWIQVFRQKYNGIWSHGFVRVAKFDFNSECIPEVIYIKEFKNEGSDFFNTVQKEYEKKCKKYIAKIK